MGVKFGLAFREERRLRALENMYGGIYVCALEGARDRGLEKTA